MSSLLTLAGLVGVLVCLVGLAKGSVRSLRLTTRGQCAKGAAVALVVLVLGGALAPDPVPDEPVAQAPTRQSSAVDPAPTPSAPPPTADAVVEAPPTPTPSGSAAPEQEVAPLLVMATGGDGDSWRDTTGVEYRMGLVNAPETDECGGAAATEYRKRALAEGFRAEVYSSDRYGRQVAVVLDAAGANLNLAMARDGIVDDRFLDDFRHENPALAAELDVAFAEARAAGRGIWGTCGSPPVADQAPPPPAADSSCHPDYLTCIPVAGDGSGRGAANDLDCGDIGQTVRLRQVGRDPYRLDGSDQDGVGCE